MIGTLEHIVSQMNSDGNVFSFELGSTDYLNNLDDRLMLPCVAYDLDSSFGFDLSQGGFIGERGKTSLFFMFKSELDYTPTDHNTNCFLPAINAARQFISLCQNSNLIDEISVSDGKFFWNKLDKNVSGIYFPFDIKLNVDKTVCATANPSTNCQPVILTINGVEVETILSGAVFPLKVTLDGTPSGAYNEATETWEVVSEPCPPSEITFTFDNNLIAVVNTSPFNIDCSTNIDVVIVNDNVDFNGTYIRDGEVNGKPQYSIVNSIIQYDGDRWIMFNDSSQLDSTIGDENYPYEAVWVGVTVSQSTIEDYCGGTHTPCADATVNVNGNLFDTVASGDNLNVPVRYVNGTPVGTIVSGVVEVPNPIVKSGRVYQRPYSTGLQQSFRDGDDWWVKTNRPAPANPTNPLYIMELDFNAANPFITLLPDNIHGNKNRFTDRLGGQTYSFRIVQDHLTGLEYPLDDNGSDIDWNGGIDYGLSSTLGGNNDWFATCESKLNVIMNKKLSVCLNYAPFNLSANLNYFTSTTSARTTTNALLYGNNLGTNYMIGSAKTTSINRRVMICRWFD